MPTANKLTDAQCRKAEPRATAYKMFDGHGLFLFVSTKGAKVWRMAYRQDGKAHVLLLVTPADGSAGTDTSGVADALQLGALM